MKKRRKIFQRAAVLLCCILMIPFLAFPASATGVTDNFMDLTDYVDAGVIAVTPDKPFFTYSLPKYSVVYYVDILFSCNGSFSSLTITKGSQTRDVTVLSLGSGIYRAYGNISGNGSSEITLNFGVTSTIYIEILSFDCSLSRSDSFAETGGLWVSDSPTSSGIVYMSSSSDAVTVYMKEYSHSDEYSFEGYTTDFNSQLYFPNWKKYDYIDVMLNLTDCNITSLHVQADGRYVPFEMSFLGVSDLDDFEVRYDQAESSSVYYPSIVDSYNRVMLRIDLSQLNRSSVSSLYVGITGQYSSNVSSITLRSVTGLISDEHSELSLFWLKLKSLLSELFGKNDPAADAAQQTQEQVDYEINLQIVEAMNEWDNNIQYAETGFGSGLSFVSPSVAWISTLASRIFTNMGGFSALYILAGFMSVIMLLLSKSGIASKISNIGRSKK